MAKAKKMGKPKGNRKEINETTKTKQTSESIETTEAPSKKKK